MTHFDYEQARFNMVEQQIRTWEVLDQRVLDLLFAVKRENFVPPAYKALAFADLALPPPAGAGTGTPEVARDSVARAAGVACAYPPGMPLWHNMDWCGTTWILVWHNVDFRIRLRGSTGTAGSPRRR